MSDIIHLLSDDLANKIAAGEVVVRPAAVVKELLENSIDAGASEIQLMIKDGGKSLIQVVDNGSGMSETDARMSFERHATSKIKRIDDLFSIKTMGFRGEALPSIAAVAKVDLKTKLHKETIGTSISIEGATFKHQEPCQCQPGTNISVKSLFYNVPARRKFLKSTSVETKHVLEEFVRIALANPDVKLLMFNDEKEVYHLPAQSLHKRISQLFGKKMQERIVPVEEQTDIVTVTGFIGKPEYAKKSKGEQYFFVNNRFIRSGYLNHAVYKAYSDYIEPKQYPLYVLFLSIDPNKIDINVHPSKHEVKFEDEQHIYTIVSAAVRHSLSKFLLTPTLDFDIDPSFNRHEFFNHTQDSSTIENETSKQKSTFLNRGEQDYVQNWEELYQFSPEEQREIDQSAQQKELLPDHESPQNKLVTQISKRYIVLQQTEGFLLIDQRRAHQRILYEQFLHTFNSKPFPSQKLLFPETVHVQPSILTTFQTIKNEINHIGFDIQEFGSDAVIIHATPADLQIENTENFIHTLLIELQHKNHGKSDIQKAIAKHLALYSAIRYGKNLTVDEMQALVQNLFRCEQPNYGIRKDKTMIQYNFIALEKAFNL